MALFRFAIGQRVRVVTHRERPIGTITERWSGDDLGDAYGENIYTVSVFVTRQRESSLERVEDESLPGGPASSNDAGWPSPLAEPP